MEITIDECEDILDNISEEFEDAVPTDEEIKEMYNFLNDPKNEENNCFHTVEAFGCDWTIHDIRMTLCHENIDRMDLSDMIMLRRKGIAA